jgi:hypothetical protein
MSLELDDGSVLEGGGSLTGRARSEMRRDSAEINPCCVGMQRVLELKRLTRSFALNV